jgi:hypothetical protein
MEWAEVGVVGCGVMMRFVTSRRLSLAVVWVSLWKDRRVGWKLLVVSG